MIRYHLAFLFQTGSNAVQPGEHILDNTTKMWYYLFSRLGIYV